MLPAALYIAPTYVPHKMKDVFLFTIFESYGSVWHKALPLSTSDLGAEVGLGTLTKNTSRFTTLRCVARNDMIAGFDTGDSLSDRFDNATGFVSQNTRKET